MKEFEELGVDVERRWHASDYDEEAFVEIARAAPERARLHERFSVSALSDMVFDAPVFPHQNNLGVRFGQPPLTVFSRPRFYIEVLFWFEGTTAIHTHGWSGAFQVLEGSSVHGTWSYETDERINRNVMLGKLGNERTTVLRRGDVEAVRPGFGLIHSLFHLDHPSISLVVRTLSDDRVPQYSIHYPGVLLNYLFQDARLTRQLEMLELLNQLDPRECVRRCQRFLSAADFLSTVLFFVKLGPILASAGELAPMFGSAAARHGAKRAEYLAAALQEFQPQLSLVDMRRTVRKPELRLYLACLMNAYDRRSFVEIVKQLQPGRDLATCVGAWTRLLSKECPSFPGLDAARRSVLCSHLDGSGATAPGGSRRLDLPPGRVAAIQEELRSHPTLGFLFREGRG